MALELKQKKMIEALEANFMHITNACKTVGICRETHYNWLDKMGDYKKAYDKLITDRIHVAESQLHKNISEGKETSLIFFLKCKGGYRETHVVENTGDITLKIT